jgi:hypothetical protein
MGSGRVALALPALSVLVLGSCDTAPERVRPTELVYLDQGWTEEERQHFYYTPQGTELHGLRYEWFRFLEMPASRERLADPARLADFGFLFDPAQLVPGYQPPLYNPANLPIGFTTHRDEADTTAMLDITCAACHTGQIEYGGRAIRIDGGPAMHAFASTRMGQFVPTLLFSLQATFSNPFKFDRFARNVLGLRYPEGKAALRVKLGEVIDAFAVEGYQMATDRLFPVDEGYGRIDALTHIAGTVFGSDLDPANFRQGTAPVSYPHLWDIWKFDWVQWNGSVGQPMARNAGEALGVKARLDLVDAAGRALPPEQMYASSVLVPELHCIETTLWKLSAPIWDERYLPPIDTARVAVGREVFHEICAGCHGPHFYPSRDEQPTTEKPIEWRMTVLPTSHIGTDPAVVDNFLDYRYDASALDPTDPGLKSIDGGRALELVAGAVVRRKYDELGLDSAQRWDFDGWGRSIETRPERGYKARPLHGIWATAPFLHNGSVPNLYEMLLPEEERSPVFWTGTHRFDPVRVGYVPTDSVGNFRFDTSISGNRNTGHQFRDDGGAGVIGRALSEEERWGVVEFLKVYGSRPEDFGTPPEGYGTRPLSPPACAPDLQGPAAHPRLWAHAPAPEAGGTGMSSSGVAAAVRDTLVARAIEAADSLASSSAAGGGR